MLSYVLISMASMASGSETARWSDLAMPRDLERAADSLLSKLLEHAVEQSLSLPTLTSVI